MANFIVNTAATKALRISGITQVVIRENAGPPVSFDVLVKCGVGETVFESASSLVDAQALAAPILVALDA